MSSKIAAHLRFPQQVLLGHGTDGADPGGVADRREYTGADEFAKRMNGGRAEEKDGVGGGSRADACRVERIGGDGAVCDHFPDMGTRLMELSKVSRAGAITAWKKDMFAANVRSEVRDEIGASASANPRYRKTRPFRDTSCVLAHRSNLKRPHCLAQIDPQGGGASRNGTDGVLAAKNEPIEFIVPQITESVIQLAVVVWWFNANDGQEDHLRAMRAQGVGERLGLLEGPGDDHTLAGERRCAGFSHGRDIPPRG